MYSRNVSHILGSASLVSRVDIENYSFVFHFVFGVEGLAPYFFETGAHFFISQNLDLGFRLEGEYEILFTQKLITEPYLELDILFQNVREFDIAQTLSHIEVGIQPRYEFTKSFAIYVDLKYEAQFQGNSLEDEKGFFYTAGLKLLI